MDDPGKQGEQERGAGTGAEAFWGGPTGERVAYVVLEKRLQSGERWKERRKGWFWLMWGAKQASDA